MRLCPNHILVYMTQQVCQDIKKCFLSHMHSKYYFYATSKGGYFTDEEKQEVLKVLSTFKAVE